MSSRSLRNIDNATLNREAYSNHLTQVKIGNLGEFNSLQNQVNILYSSIDLSGGGEGPIQDVVDAINNISNDVDALQASQTSIQAGTVEIQQDISSIYLLSAQVNAANVDNVFLDSSNASVNADKSFQYSLAFKKLNVAGFVRNGTNGSLVASGLLGNVDFSPSANISQSKLATITTTGKVANRALSATSLRVPNAIAERDAAGNVYVLQQLPGATNYKVATNGFVVTEFNRLVDNANTTLNTLGELANALGNDPNFYANVNSSIASKASILDASFSGNCVVTANLVVSTLNVSGILRNDASGNLYSSQLNVNDLSSVIFYNSNLETITTVGKVATSATSATYTTTPNSIVLRDASGMLFGNNVINSMYSAIRDKDLSWNTWGYYPLSKTRAPIAPYALRSWSANYYNETIQAIYLPGTVAWSPELKILVHTTTLADGSNKFSYSRDYYNWTVVPVNDIHTYGEISWSRELGIFVAVGTSVLYSSTGTSWSRNGVYLPVFTNTWSSVCWSPELGMFVAVASSGGTNNRAMRSFDGKTWEITTTPNSNTWVCVSWAAELGLFVAVSSNGGSTCAMWSNDGLNWYLATSMPAVSGCYSVTWSPDLGIFYAASTSTPVYLSRDGKTWTQYESTGIAIANTRCLWSQEYKRFFAVGNSRHVWSFNGIHWTEAVIANVSNFPVGYIPECGLMIMNLENGITMNAPNTAFPSTFNLFDGPYAFTTETGTQYFDLLKFSSSQTFTNPINTYGVKVSTLSSNANIQCIGNGRFVLSSNLPQPGKVFTCWNTDPTNNSGWSPPVGTRINSTIFTDSPSIWTSSGTTTRIAQVILPFGVWMVYYKISIQPTGGNSTATQLIAGISSTSQSMAFVPGSGSRYKDDFQRPITSGKNTPYIPRTCIITSTSATTTPYYLNAQLSFNAGPTSVRAHYESYMYAIKIK